jgi:hypothetical protein
MLLYEQSALYPTKRKLPLVCKLCATLSTEFLYECIAIGVIREPYTHLEQLLTTLQQTDRGAELAMFVKRIDLDSGLLHFQDLFTTFLPGLRILRSWKECLAQPLYITLKEQPALSDLSALLAVGDMVASIDTAPSDSQLRWKALTIIIDVFEYTEKLPTLNQPIPYLKYLTLIINKIEERDIQGSLSRLQGWSLPSLTHLSFHLYNVELRRAVKDVVGIFGRQLEFFALTGDGTIQRTDKSWFCEMLTAAPNLKELSSALRQYQP